MAFESFFVFCLCGDKFISVPKGSKRMDHARSMRFLYIHRAANCRVTNEMEVCTKLCAKNKSQ